MEFTNDLLSYKLTRSYLPENFSFQNWEDVRDYFEDLKNRTFLNESDFEKWLKNRSELEVALQEAVTQQMKSMLMIILFLFQRCNLK